MKKVIKTNANGKMSVEITKDDAKLDAQIRVLERAVATDIREIDREMHQMALDALKREKTRRGQA